MSENMVSGTNERKAVATEYTCPHCSNNFVIERTVTSQTRGMLAGLKLSDMTTEQLKREKINASSVLYKATKRNAPAELIERNQARVTAVVDELTLRGLIAKEVEPISTAGTPVTEEPIVAENEAVPTEY